MTVLVDRHHSSVLSVSFLFEAEIRCVKMFLAVESLNRVGVEACCYECQDPKYLSSLSKIYDTVKHWFSYVRNR